MKIFFHNDKKLKLEALQTELENLEEKHAEMVKSRPKPPSLEDILRADRLNACKKLTKPRLEKNNFQRIAKKCFQVPIAGRERIYRYIPSLHKADVEPDYKLVSEKPVERKLPTDMEELRTRMELYQKTIGAFISDRKKVNQDIANMADYKKFLAGHREGDTLPRMEQNILDDTVDDYPKFSADQAYKTLNLDYPKFQFPKGDLSWVLRSQADYIARRNTKAKISYKRPPEWLGFL